MNDQPKYEYSCFLKVQDRNAWRTSIEERKFHPQVETLIWGGKLETKSNRKDEQSGRDDDDNSSEASSSLEGENTSNTARKNVVNLACSLLQLAQSVETKYLKKPLGKPRLFFYLMIKI